MEQERWDRYKSGVLADTVASNGSLTHGRAAQLRCVRADVPTALSLSADSSPKRNANLVSNPN